MPATEMNPKQRFAEEMKQAKCDKSTKCSWNGKKTVGCSRNKEMRLVSPVRESVRRVPRMRIPENLEEIEHNKLTENSVNSLITC